MYFYIYILNLSTSNRSKKGMIKMRTMKMFKYTLVGLMLMGSAATFAQERADQRADKLKKELNLSDEQAEDIRKMKESHMITVKKIKADQSITEEVKKAQLKQLKENHRTKVRGVLTPEQVVQLDALEAQKKEARKKTPGERAEAKTERMRTDLNLTEDQVERVRILNLKVENKIQAIRDDASMSKEKKREFIKGNKEDHKRVMESILTPEQLETYEALQAERKAKKANKREMRSEAPAENAAE